MSKEYYDFTTFPDCVENAICCHCGKEHTWDEDTCAVYQEKFVCENCFQEHYGYCDECGELNKYSEMNDENICRGCENNG